MSIVDGDQVDGCPTILFLLMDSYLPFVRFWSQTSSVVNVSYGLLNKSIDRLPSRPWPQSALL